MRIAQQKPKDAKNGAEMRKNGAEMSTMLDRAKRWAVSGMGNVQGTQSVIRRKIKEVVSSAKQVPSIQSTHISTVYESCTVFE